MSAARDAILGRIRAALADVPRAEERWRADPVRSGSGMTPAAIAALFAERARGYKVRVEETSRADAPAVAARLLGERGHGRIAAPTDLPADLVPDGVDLVRDEGLDNAALAACDGVVTTCGCAIAETGTLVLDHGPGQGRRVLTLLPDYHLCIVDADRIVGQVPEAVARMAGSVRAGRPLTFISGPSATSDIELNRVEGVHGPRTLDVLIVHA